MLTGKAENSPLRNQPECRPQPGRQSLTSSQRWTRSGRNGGGARVAGLLQLESKPTDVMRKTLVTILPPLLAHHLIIDQLEGVGRYTDCASIRIVEQDNQTDHSACEERDHSAEQQMRSQP